MAGAWTTSASAVTTVSYSLHHVLLCSCKIMSYKILLNSDSYEILHLLTSDSYTIVSCQWEI